MKKEIDKAFAKKLFGTRYERAGKTFLICLIVYCGLHLSGVRLRISPFVIYLMSAAVTAGIMWQALCAGTIKNMLMLPFERQEFVFSYISILGCYALLTKTGIVWAVVFAVSPQNPVEIAVSAVCAWNAVLMPAVLFSQKSKRGYVFIWAVGLAAVLIFLKNSVLLLAVFAVNGIFAAALLKYADPYCFCPQESIRRHTVKSGQKLLMWRYFFRYLTSHRNYLLNTAFMCGVACILPHFFGEAEDGAFVPIGFAILSVNTPLSVLLSCDPALEQAVRCLPGQKKAFCLPYGMFVFSVNLLVDAVFLCSYRVQTGGFGADAALFAVVFALLGAIGFVLLEWFFPIRGWKIESDLWHHPRKYIVPVLLAVIAGAVGVVR